MNCDILCRMISIEEEKEEILMRGLREAESPEFNNYFSLVQAEAAKQGCVFFLDMKEGRPFSEEEMAGENLSGWLVPVKDAEAFERDYLEEEIDMKWDKAYHFAFWKKERGHLGIRFMHYTTIPHEHEFGHAH